METLIIQSKDKATSQQLKKFLKGLNGIESISVLSSSDKEDLAMINAINKGKTGSYVDTVQFLKKLKH